MSDSIVQSILSRQDVTSKEVKYLLWIAYCKLQEAGVETIGDEDGAEACNIDDMLDVLDLDLGLLPGGGE